MIKPPLKIASSSTASHDDRARRPNTSRSTITPEDKTTAVAPKHSVDRQFATNLSRGLEVLQAFALGDVMLGNREISERTHLPKATVSRLTYTLTLMGYLSYSQRFRKYRLGLGVLALGYPLLASMRIRQIARPFMEKIAKETGCAVNLGMRDRLTVIYIDSCSADPGNIFQPDIGSSRPLLTTSIGRALLLGAPPEECTTVLNRLRLQDPQQFAIDKALLDADAQRFREQGYCHSGGDLFKQIHAIAVPLRRRDPEDPGAALNCSTSNHRKYGDFLAREVAPRLLEGALMIEHTCGLR